MRLVQLRSARFLLLAAVTAVGCGLAACSDDDDGDGATKLGPPSLQIIGFRASDGSSFDPDESPVALCEDKKLAVQIGPNENAADQLDNWFLRPPGDCGTAVQCGYVVTTVTSEDGSEEVSSASSTTTIPLDLTELSLVGEVELRVELHQGATGRAFLVNGAPVADEVKLSFDVRACAAAGGAGGMDGAGTGGMGLGGAGGFMGGQGGALGGMGGH